VALTREPLTLEDREDISRGLAKGLENKDIAASIGRDESVVSREIARHGGREGYQGACEISDLKDGSFLVSIAGRVCAGHVVVS